MQNDSSPQFTFDKVHGLPYGASNTQTDIFSDVQDIVLGTLEGLNGCIMAYGQAGMQSDFSWAHLNNCNTAKHLVNTCYFLLHHC